MHLNIIKAIHNKPIGNNILNNEKLKAIPLRPGKRQGCPLLPVLFKIRSPSQSNYKRKRNKRHQNWKRRSKTVTICG